MQQHLLHVSSFYKTDPLNLLSSPLLSKNINIKGYKNIILLVASYVRRNWSVTFGAGTFEGVSGKSAEGSMCQAAGGIFIVRNFNSVIEVIKLRRMKLASQIWATKKFVNNIMVRNSEWKRCRCTWEIFMKIDLKEIQRMSVDRFRLARNKNQLWILVNTVI
jgi:hypothetical protein